MVKILHVKINKKFIYFFLIVYSIQFLLPPINMLFKTIYYDKTMGNVEYISDYKSRGYLTPDGRGIKIGYTYKLDSQEYESINVYDLTMVTVIVGVSEGDDVIIYYKKNNPQISITSYEINESLLKGFIALIFPIVIVGISRGRYRGIVKGSINKNSKT